jgi:hypothetical protein
MKKSRLSYERHHQWRALGRWLHLRDRASSSSCPPVVAGLLLLAVHLPSLPPQSGLTVNPNSGEKSDRSSMTVHLLSSPTTTTTFIRYFSIFYSATAGRMQTTPFTGGRLENNLERAESAATCRHKSTLRFTVRPTTTTKWRIFHPEDFTISSSCRGKKKIQFGFLVFCWWWNSRSS